MAISDYPLTEVAEGIQCRCPDPEAHEVAALVAGGMDQRTASLMVYSERGQLTRSIVASFMAKFPDLRLPGVTS